MPDLRMYHMSSLPEGVVPEEVQLLPFGEHMTDKGRFVVDEEAAAAVMAEFASRANDRVVDYEHQTLTGNVAPAAGWIKRLVNKGAEGIWGVVSWTPVAEKFLRRKEYRYLSPVFIKRVGDDRVVRLVNAALTNQPAIDGMVPVVAKESSAGGEVPPRTGESEPITKEGVTMKELLKALGLAADATEAQALTALSAMKEAHGVVQAAHKETLVVLGLPESASASEARGTIMAMKQGADQVTALTARVKELEGKLTAGEAEGLVEQAMKEGKITPAQKDWALKSATRDPEEFRTFVAKAPVVMDLGKTPPPPGGEGKERQLEEEVQVCKQLGVTSEQIEKYGKTKEGK